MKKIVIYLVGIMFVASMAVPFTALASDPAAAPAEQAADDAKSKDASDDGKKEAAADGAEKADESFTAIHHCGSNELAGNEGDGHRAGHVPGQHSPGRGNGLPGEHWRLQIYKVA